MSDMKKLHNELFKSCDWSIGDEVYDYSIKNNSKFSCDKLKNPDSEVLLYHKTRSIDNDIKRGHIGGHSNDYETFQEMGGYYAALTKKVTEDWLPDVKDYIIGKDKVRNLFADWEFFGVMDEDDCLEKVMEKRSKDFDTSKAMKVFKNITKKGKYPPNTPLSDLYPICKSMGENWFLEYSAIYGKGELKIDLYEKNGECFKKNE